jgi:2'-5' RNA ligase
MRTFIAFEIEDRIKKKLDEFIRRMKRLDGPVRWVRPQDLHLTIKFLGEISTAQAVEVSSILDRIVSLHSSFTLCVAGVGTFPAHSPHPRVIWAGISQKSLLSALQADLEKALQHSGFPSEKRAFNPHLTLGRVKSPQGANPLLQALQDNEHFAFGAMQVNRIILFKSDLMPKGAEYSKIHIGDLSS